MFNLQSKKPLGRLQYMPSSYRRVTEPSLKRAPGEREKKGFLGLLEPFGKEDCAAFVVDMLTYASGLFYRRVRIFHIDSLGR